LLFLTSLVASLNLDDVQVDEYGGKHKLKHYLAELNKRPGFDRVRSVGVTRDADLDVAGAFASVRGLLLANGFTPPDSPGEVKDGLLNVGVFILPDNNRAGMLEDLCLDAVREDPALACVDEFLTCIETRAARRPGNFPKARLQSWLASQIEPGKRLGEAAQAGYWPWGSPAFEPLRQFVQLL
jgi:hypothetical protein